MDSAKDLKSYKQRNKLRTERRKPKDSKHKFNKTINDYHARPSLKYGASETDDINPLTNDCFITAGGTYNEWTSAEQAIPQIGDIATQQTFELLHELPNLCKNYKTEYVMKGKNRNTVFKVRLPPKK